MDAVFLIGRIVFAVLFISAGLMGQLGQRRQSTEFAKSMGAPAPELLVPLSGVVIVLGGLAVALGVWADIGALAIAAFLLAMLPTMHAFWKVDDPMMRQMQMSHFMKNLSLVGGALIIFWVFNQAQGDAPLSIGDPLFSRW
jgi:uncharacterized membrane protein YphA (DoxX/SURF4 family)